MAVPKSAVTDAELDILKVLWDAGIQTARQITIALYEDVNASSIATVQKLLARLEEKGLVKRERSKIPHQFAAASSRQDVAGIQLKECAEKLSAGSLSPFVVHLVQNRRLTKSEKNQIRRLLDD